MTDWFKKMTGFISTSEDNVTTSKESIVVNKAILRKLEKIPTSFVPVKPPNIEPPKKEPVMATKVEEDDNLKALKRLRDLPRGSQADSRIAAIQNLLGEPEIFKTLKMLRWPQGVLCPKCHSSNVIKRDPPPDAIDQRHFYICLNCKGDGGSGDFDDFTDLPLNSMHALRQWVLCWYLIGFCSVHQIAKVLGISAAMVAQMAAIGTEIADLPDEEAKQEMAMKEKKAESTKHKSIIEQEEDYTRSASKAPLKPGYKSKK